MASASIYVTGGMPQESVHAGRGKGPGLNNLLPEPILFFSLTDGQLCASLPPRILPLSLLGIILGALLGNKFGLDIK